MEPVSGFMVDGKFCETKDKAIITEYENELLRIFGGYSIIWLSSR